MKRVWIIVLIVFYHFAAVGQTHLAIGEWQSLFPYIGGYSIAESPSRIYFSSNLGIVGFKKDDTDDRVFYSKVEGLSSSERAKLLYQKGARALIAVYGSGVIDIITAEGVFTMKDIATFDNFPIDRTANFIYDLGGNEILLSADFGISRIDVVRGKVLGTTFTVGNPVNSALRKDGKYYAATDEGLFTIEENALVENFSLWKEDTSMARISSGGRITGVTDFNDKIYISTEHEVYRLEDTTWRRIYADPDREVVHLTTGKRHLLVSYYCESGCNSKVIAIDDDQVATESQSNCSNRVIEALEDDLGNVWYADEWDNFRVAKGGNGHSCQQLKVNGPERDRVNDVAVGEEELAVASGGTINGFTYAFRNDGFYVLDKEGHWTTHNLFNTPELKERDLKSFHRVAIHPETGDQYYATYWGGVVVYHKDGTYTFYDESNSALRKKDPNDPRERCTDVTFDQDNNLWVTTYQAPENSLAVLRNDGTWEGYTPPNFGQGPNQVAIDQYGNKWVTLYGDNARGVYVFNEGDPTNGSDDRGYVFNRLNSALPSNNAICVTVDLEGDVWVGTDAGAIVFECGSDDVFEGRCTGSQRKVEQDTILGLLLLTEEVRCIAVDGANRKWFGTRNGVYVQSPSGEEQILELNITNSPLPDNLINDIAIDQNNGTVYIATDKGIVAYKSDATRGRKTHASEVYAYPNPVRPGYDGPIAIKGLPQNAEVRITDISGQLFYQTESLGGQAIWDGRDYNGHKAASGVYLVFSTSEAGDFEDPEALVTKILIVN